MTIRHRRQRSEGAKLKSVQCCILQILFILSNNSGCPRDGRGRPNSPQSHGMRGSM